MDRGVKILTASGVLLGGFLLAALFRDDSHVSAPQRPVTGERLVLRRQLVLPSDSQEVVVAPNPRIAGSHEFSPRPLDDRSPTILHAMEPSEPPPALAEEYPGAAEQSGGGPRVDKTATRRPDGKVRTASSIHKIVDGDTLRLLAERYLGSAERYLDIYEANRELLPSPQVLPIGAKLTIPAGTMVSSPKAQLMPSRPVVSVQPPS